MGFGFPALVVQRGHVGTWIALDVDSRGHDSARLRAKPRRADVVPDVAYDSGRWQCLACLLSEPRRARFGCEPLHQLVLFSASRLRRDNLSSIAYSEKLNSSTISATLQSTDRHHGIVGQKRSHFQLDS
jgi:hypothetical protein